MVDNHDTIFFWCEYTASLVPQRHWRARWLFCLTAHRCDSYAAEYFFFPLPPRDPPLSSHKGQPHQQQQVWDILPCYYAVCRAKQNKKEQKPKPRQCRRDLAAMSVQPLTFLNSAPLLISFLVRPSVQFTASIFALLSPGASLHSSFMKSGSICQLCFPTSPVLK